MARNPLSRPTRVASVASAQLDKQLDLGTQLSAGADRELALESFLFELVLDSFRCPRA